MSFSYPLKHAFIEYFQLNQIDNTVTARKLNDYLETVIRNSSNPQEKALEIWDTFVMTNDNFFDIQRPYNMYERVVELREQIVKENKIGFTLLAFGSIGVSPFCQQHQSRDIVG